MTNKEVIPAEDNQLVDDSWFDQTLRGMRIVRPPTFDEWYNTGAQLAVIQRSLPMLIGDFLNAGEDTFGEKYSQVVNLFGEYEYHTVANYAHVMRKVPYERRIGGLTYSHYKAVAYLEDEQEQIDAQEKAKENSWTAKELWEYTHREETRKFPDFIDELSRGISMLYSLSTSREQDEHLDEANRHLMLAKENYEQREEV